MPGPTLPNMSLVTPLVAGDSGIWGTELNTALGLVDAHDHSPGKGVLVPVSGLNINTDLSLGGTHALANALACDFTPVASSSVSSYAGALWVNSADNELYWRTTSGTNVKLTAGTSINTTLVGGIVGDYTSVGAQVAYDNANLRYTFKEASATGWARMAHGDMRLYPTSGTGAVFVGQACPGGIGSSYTMTWPTALPGAGAIVQVDNTGAISFSNALASNQNLTLSGTGYTKTGNRTITVPISSSNGCIQQAGGISTASGAGAKPGCVFAVSTTALIPIPLIDSDGQRASVSAVTVHGAWTGTGNITTQLFEYVYAADVLTSIGSSVAQAINSSLTANPTSPTVPTVGDYLMVSVITAGTNSGKVTSLEVTYSIP